MPKLLRPYIPLEVRCRVAARQLGYKHIDNMIALAAPPAGCGYGRLLETLQGELRSKLGFDLQLDHDPALENRPRNFWRGKFTGYYPDANDPDFLIYREKHAHHIKTNVRGDHGQYPDNTIAKRERRRIKKLTKPKRKYKWPRGRKLRSRNTFRSRP